MIPIFSKSSKATVLIVRIILACAFLLMAFLGGIASVERTHTEALRENIRNLHIENERSVQEIKALKTALEREKFENPVPEPETSSNRSKLPACFSAGCDGYLCAPHLNPGENYVAEKLVAHAYAHDEQPDIDWAKVDQFEVHYDMWHVNTGDKRDSSYDRGRPAKFREAQVIKGFAKGVKELNRVGEKVRVRFDKSLGYGDRQGLDGDLIFDIELISVTYLEGE